MRVNRAKQRLRRWERYVRNTGTKVSSNVWRGGTHTGHARAYSDVMYANRYYPKGVRDPYLLPLSRRGT